MDFAFAEKTGPKYSSTFIREATPESSFFYRILNEQNYKGLTTTSITTAIRINTGISLNQR
jgi:hypothetical protein